MICGEWFGEVGLDHQRFRKNNKLRSLWVVLVSFQFDLNIHFFLMDTKKQEESNLLGFCVSFSGVFVVIFFPEQTTQSEDVF